MLTSPEPTIWQENASRFATRREDVDARLDMRRREGIAQVRENRDRDGSRKTSLWLVMRSFQDQLAIAGLDTARIPGTPAYPAESHAGVVRMRTGGRHAAREGWAS